MATAGKGVAYKLLHEIWFVSAVALQAALSLPACLPPCLPCLCSWSPWCAGSGHA